MSEPFIVSTGNTLLEAIMKKVGILIFTVALVLGLVASNIFSFGHVGSGFLNLSMKFGRGIQGSGNVTVEKRDLKGFKSVDVGGIFQVDVIAGKDFSVEVEADDNLLSHIETEVRGDTLYIETNGRIKSSNAIKVRVTAPNVDKLDASGVANVSLSGVKNDALTLSSSGASKVTVSGETSQLNVDVSGATKILADQLKAANASIEASGASYVGVNVSGELNSDLSGASKVEYTGTPSNVVTKKSGASRVSAK